MTKTVRIKLDTWERFDAWMAALSNRGTRHTPQDLAEVAGELGFVEPVQETHGGTKA